MSFVPQYPVPLRVRVSDAVDSRGRPIDAWEDGDTLTAIAVAPATDEQKSEARERKHEAAWQFFFPRATAVPLFSRLVWQGVELDVVSVLDYSHGLADLGGVVAVAGRVGGG